MRQRHQWWVSASLVLAVTCLLVTGCGSTSSANGRSSPTTPSTPSTPQLEGIWTGLLTDTKLHLGWAKFNLRLTQDSSNQLGGMVRLYDEAWGDKVGCFPLTGTAQPQATFHLDGQKVVSGDVWFVQFDGTSATTGYALSGVYGLERTTLAQLSGTMARATEEELSFSCPSYDSATPTP